MAKKSKKLLIVAGSIAAIGGLILLSKNSASNNALKKDALNHIGALSAVTGESVKNNINGHAGISVVSITWGNPYNQTDYLLYSNGQYVNTYNTMSAILTLYPPL